MSKDFCARLTQVIAHSGLMVQAFAEKLRLAPDTLSKIKNGRLRLTERNAEIIERVFGYSAHWLLTGEGEMRGPRMAEAGTDYLTERARPIKDMIDIRLSGDCPACGMLLRWGVEFCYACAQPVRWPDRQTALTMIIE